MSTFSRMLSIATQLFLALAMAITAQSQGTLKGSVKAADGTVLSGCSIFLSNTSVGTLSDEDGRFTLTGFPRGQYDLIVSHIGFETYSVPLESAHLPEKLSIVLQPKVAELEAVTVGGYEKGTWKEWGPRFLDAFIGQGILQYGVTLENPKALAFRYYEKRQELIAVSDEPLLIVNKKLGYRIRYQLESFSLQLSGSRLFFVGFPYFEEMDGSPSRKARWMRNRENAYEGSLMHFLRSVFDNRIMENQFEVQRYKQMADTTWNTGTSATQSDAPRYTVRRYALLSKPQLTGDSIAYAPDSVTLLMYFPDRLQVTYVGKKNTTSYRSSFDEPDPYPASYLILENNEPVQIFHYGSFYPPANLTIAGFWGWSEKIARMLPFDYKPPVSLPGKP